MARADCAPAASRANHFWLSDRGPPDIFAAIRAIASSIASSGADARKTGSLSRLMRHRERVHARLDHPFDPTPIRFAFSTRPLEQRLKIAERRKINLTRLLNRFQKRTHKPTFHRVNMHAPVPRRLFDPRDFLRETEVPTPPSNRCLPERYAFS